MIRISHVDSKMNVVFSFFREEESLADQYLHRLLYASGPYQKYLISKVVLQHCENVVVSPSYYGAMSKEKKQVLIDFFRQTLFENKPDYDNEDLYLF